MSTLLGDLLLMENVFPPSVSYIRRLGQLTGYFRHPIIPLRAEELPFGWQVCRLVKRTLTSKVSDFPPGESAEHT